MHEVPAAAAREPRAQEALDGLRMARSLAIDLGKQLSVVRGSADIQLALEINDLQIMLHALVETSNHWLARIADAAGEVEP